MSSLTLTLRRPSTEVGGDGVEEAVSGLLCRCTGHAIAAALTISA